MKKTAKTFPEKVLEARKKLGISQKELGRRMGGVSARSIQFYELGRKAPRTSTMMYLSRELNVSITYLTVAECTNPQANIRYDPFIRQAFDLYGVEGAREMHSKLSNSEVAFAGGEIPDSEREAFYAALLEVYISCKEEAKRKYGRKKKVSPEDDGEQ